MSINSNSLIDTPIEVLVAVLVMFIIMIILCKLGSMLDSIPVSDKSKSKKKEVVKEVKKEVKKDIKKEIVKDIKEVSSEKDKSVTVDTTNSSSTNTASVNNSSTVGNCSSGGYVCPYSNISTNSAMMYPGCDNYLHDRFAVTPTREDYVQEKRISDSFMSDDELDSIRNRDVKIRVNDVDSNIGTKESLHRRISQMTSHNKETREKLLDEFEGLSREMKLLIIENIIQKM